MDIEVRGMTRREFDIATEWLAEERWNPVLHDGDCFYVADPDGFLIALLNGEPVGCVSAVRYGEDLGFAGLFIVRKEFRGRGIGTALGREALQRMGGRTVGADAVLERAELYAQYGFVELFHSFRYRGVAGAETCETVALTDLRDVDFERLADFDAAHFGARRERFLKAWIAQPGGHGVARFEDGEIAGYGYLRKCRVGYKFGPVFASGPAIARDILDSLSSRIPGEKLFLDVPGANPEGTALAEEMRMTAIYETARMYRGEPPALPVDEIYGITSFELG